MYFFSPKNHFWHFEFKPVDIDFMLKNKEKKIIELFDQIIQKFLFNLISWLNSKQYFDKNCKCN